MAGAGCIARAKPQTASATADEARMEYPPFLGCWPSGGFTAVQRNAAGNDHGNSTLDQIGSQRRQAIELIFRKAEQDFDVPAFDITAFIEGLPQCSHIRPIAFRGAAAEIAEHRYRALLRPRRAWAAETCNEFAGPHKLSSALFMRAYSKLGRNVTS